MKGERWVVLSIHPKPSLFPHASLLCWCLRARARRELRLIDRTVFSGGFMEKGNKGKTMKEYPSCCRWRSIERQGKQ
jgi:hypothetical protein